MPYKAKKPCAANGCAELTHNKYCVTHARSEMRDYNMYKRNPETIKRYGGGWKKIRRAFLMKNPVCQNCEKNNKIIPAEIVHHIITLDNGGTNEFDNLVALCNNCHEKIHAECGERF
jgi:5-methylcytosine-specific restriction protein A